MAYLIAVDTGRRHRLFQTFSDPALTVSVEETPWEQAYFLPKAEPEAKKEPPPEDHPTHRPRTDWTTSDSVAELAELAKTAGLEVAGILVQGRPFPDSGTYLGSGKVGFLKEEIARTEATVVIADDELSPGQQRNLEETLKVKVIDRTGLILEIFARRAQSHEAKLQVELAQLEYLRPRLTRMWTHLSRLGGGIGTRGPGETQLEVDKRRIDERVQLLKTKLEKVKKHRALHRSNRDKVATLSGAIVGYTNAGKSTLMNLLTQADVLVEDQLFATLDPTTRELKLPSNDAVVISDTVGFIQKLPHQLVTSFRATLEEVMAADFLIHVVDVSNPKFPVMVSTALEILAELNIIKPQIWVFNKADLVSDWSKIEPAIALYQRKCVISAKSGKNIDLLLGEIQRLIQESNAQMRFDVPYSKMDIVTLLHDSGTVLSVEYGPDRVHLHVQLNKVIGEKILGLLHGQ